MKVLGVVGSPRRKGNTDLLVQDILKGAEEVGASTEIVYLDELKILPCDGRHACWKGRGCNKKDDMCPLFEKIGSSDVIVFGTPVYWFGPSAMMKGFLDRFVYFNCPQHEIMVNGNKAILVVPFEDDVLETADPLVDMFTKSFDYLKMDLFATLLVSGVTKRGEVATKKNVMRPARETGKKVVE